MGAFGYIVRTGFLFSIKIQGGGKMEEKVKKCSICDADMPLVGYVDKDSKEDIGIEPTEKFRMLGGFLSVSLRKYKCPNGHEATNEESESKSKVDSFEDAETLVSYMEMAIKMESCVHKKHFILLCCIADEDNIFEIQVKLASKKLIYLSDYSKMVTDARSRLDKGLIPKDWLESARGIIYIPR